MKYALMMGLVLAVTDVALADQDARLRYGERLQQPGQSDYDFAGACTPMEANTLALGDDGWDREQDRIERKHEQAFYAICDWIARQRGDRMLAFDLKLRFQDEARSHHEEYVGKMEAYLAGVDGSSSLLDQTLAAEYRAAVRTGRFRLATTRQKIADLESQRRKAAALP